MSFVVENWKTDWYQNAVVEERQSFRHWLLEHLRNERMNISFIKADGTRRLMHCSLHAELLPAGDYEVEPEEHKDYVHVFDLDKQAWRTIKLDKIIDFSYNLGMLHI